MHLIVSHLIPFNINSLLSFGAPGTMRIFVFFLPCNRESEWMLGCVIKRRRPTTFRAVWASLDCETQFDGIKTELSKEFGVLLFWLLALSLTSKGNSEATNWDFKHSTIKFYDFHTWKLLFSLSLSCCCYLLQLLGHRKTSRCSYMSRSAERTRNGTNKKSILISHSEIKFTRKKETVLFKCNRNRRHSCQLSNFTHFSYWLNPKCAGNRVECWNPPSSARQCYAVDWKIDTQKIFKLNK